jgi:hypothetical protein
MISLEDLAQELRDLTPEQLEQVAQLVHEFSIGNGKLGKPKSQNSMPESIVQQAVRNGWPCKLFTELIGSLPDLERAPQPPYTIRKNL